MPLHTHLCATLDPSLCYSAVLCAIPHPSLLICAPLHLFLCSSAPSTSLYVPLFPPSHPSLCHSAPFYAPLHSPRVISVCLHSHLYPFIPPCMLCTLHVSLCPTLHPSVPLFLLHITVHVYQFILAFFCVPLCTTLHPACLCHFAPIYVICTPP